jgi:LacI family transcriptional regulator
MVNESKPTSTINDVARLAGVSKRTVSRVLNNSPKVNAETREKIEKIIAELAYAPSKQARGLASSRSYLIGLLYDDPNAIVIHSVQKGILDACASHGYEMVVHPTPYQSDDLIGNVLNFVARSKLDGLVIMPPISANEELVSALQNQGIPYVRLIAKMVDEEEKIIVSNDRSAMQQVADLFHQKGRKDIGVILGPPHRLATAERFEGLKSALAVHGLSINKKHVDEGDFSYESGLASAKKILSAKTRPDAIFASNDQMAIAVIHTAEDLGIKIPEELIVVGYDDEPMSARLRPSLTTLKRSNENMAEAAALKLIAAITDNPTVAKNVTTEFTPQLILRQSTGSSDKG